MSAWENLHVKDEKEISCENNIVSREAHYD